jgi:hypothetical protein
MKKDENFWGMLVDGKVICISCLRKILDESEFPHLVLITVNPCWVEQSKCPMCGGDWKNSKIQKDAEYILKKYVGETSVYDI